MATIQRAHQAQAILSQVYTLNNQAVAAVNAIKALRDKLVALPQSDRDEVVAAIADLGFDAGEIQTILGQWNTLHGQMTAGGIVALPPVSF